MNVLVVATKAPWPPLDGGRVLLLNTLQGLAAAGCRLTLVAPVDPGSFRLDDVARELSPWCTPRLVPARPRRVLGALLKARGAPLSIARHSLPAVRGEVERLLGEERFDLVHAEQLQALPQAEPAFVRGIPVILRAQNVESNLWSESAFRSSGVRGRFLWREASRLATWEGRAVARASATLALTEKDAAWLRTLSGEEDRVRVVRAPFPELPARTRRLQGEPAVVIFGSKGWLPNEESAAWFLGEVWPVVRAAMPGAALHLFGAEPRLETPGVVPHPPPADSAEVYAPGSILVVPLRLASGVRIKILEAWARGVPVVATPSALAGLEAEDGREVLSAWEPPQFAAAIARLHREPGLSAALVEAGRWALRERHDPEKIARRMMGEYEGVILRTPPPEKSPPPAGAPSPARRPPDSTR